MDHGHHGRRHGHHDVDININACTEKRAGFRESHHYAAPPCIADGSIDGVWIAPLEMQAGEAFARGYRPDDACRNTGAWFQDNRSGVGRLLEYVGILSPFAPRWNDDGTWNF